MIVASAILGLGAFGAGAPAAAFDTRTLQVSGTATTPPATQSPGYGESSEGGQPNVGDETPKGMEFGEKHNLLTDESGLIAIGLAALIGAGTAILVMRNRRKHAIY